MIMVHTHRVYSSTALEVDSFADCPTVAKALQAAKDAEKSRGEGRPINFGIVLPGAIYRSSFPMTEDFHFLGTLGLKTVV